MVGEVDKERLLFAYQISKQIVHGRFPLNKELAFELTALMAQVKIFYIFGLYRPYLAFFGFFSLFWSCQIRKKNLYGRFPLNKELAFELTALMEQV